MNCARRSNLRLAICLGLLSLIGTGTRAQSERSRQAGTPYDLVVRGGRVMDPESGLDTVRNIGISDGIIRSVSTAPLEGRAMIDAIGLVVAPGFIDMDGWPENARLQVRDGVTTVLNLRAGTAEVDRWYSEHERGAVINFGVSIGYLRVRSEVMRDAGGTERKGTKPSEAQLAEILRKLQRGFDEGAVALGMGSSAGPDPTGWEHVEAFRVAAGVGAHVVATLRDDIWSQSNIPANLSQMIGAAALSGTSVHIPHLTSSGGPHTPRLLEMIARAQAHGLNTTAEDYPYRAAVITIRAGEMDDWSDQEIREIQPLEADERLTRGSSARYRDRDFEAFVHNDSIEPFVAQAIASPLVSIASHGSEGSWAGRGGGHPRTSGTFSRVLGHYVREKGALSLMEALRKMTLMPAQRLAARVSAMRNKGRIRKGADADIVVFDPGRTIDRATFQDQRPSEGVRYVLVNGVLVVRDGVVQEGVFAGRPVRAPSSSARKSK